MAFILYRKTKTGRTYAYRSESYWDSDKQQPRSRRTYLGWVDPETGEIVKGRADKSKKPSSVETESSSIKKKLSSTEETASKDEEICQLRADLEKKTDEVISLRAEIQRLSSKVDELNSLCRKISEMTRKVTGS